jgi:hypothetical protein
LEERVLKNLLGILRVSHQTQGMVIDPSAVPIHEFRESRFFPGLGSVNQR